MSGAIMPAPLAMPLIVTLVLPIFAVARDLFGQVREHVVQRLFEIFQPRVGRARNVRRAFSFPGRE